MHECRNGVLRCWLCTRNLLCLQIKPVNQTSFVLVYTNSPSSLSVILSEHYKLGIYIQRFSALVQYFGSALWYLSKQLVKLALSVPTQYSNFGNVIGNIQGKLGNHALKSDLKFTVSCLTENVFSSIFCIYWEIKSLSCNLFISWRLILAIMQSMGRAISLIFPPTAIWCRILFTTTLKR